jgi:ubiquinone/menaquinone biosynthesis C-methylase UbiE
MNLCERDNIIEELLDAPVADPQVLARNLRDIRRINWMLGWTRLAQTQVARLVAEYQLRSFSLLDVATGSADIPRAVARWARRQPLQVEITASDRSAPVLAAARAACTGYPEIRLATHDARTLPYAAQSFDLVLCSLALHHFGPAEAPALLRELTRVARRAVLVSDLHRSRPLYLGAWLLTHTLMPNRLTRHDAPASVRRAYTPGEVRALAEQAGLHTAHIRTVFPFRQVLIWERPALHPSQEDA